jgi:hypothetical protein
MRAVQTLMGRSQDSVTTLGVTRVGFMQLQAMMIQQQRLDICWTMLRSFGYNRQLHLKPEMFTHIKDLQSDPVCSPPNHDCQPLLLPHVLQPVFDLDAVAAAGFQ